ncbi:hypothetical protein F53441_14168 [Fusarium austroafricanum]|uniref:Uncharacterized protein n=1 Tax=Fusarium austroafricanum TaxID=2364996 RepID=A0A8H4JG14_9HYPO|nr:hypothetical protein F53441_14168 [Fusarium austroafricanum]
MSSLLSSYIFDDEGMTLVTCDICAGSFLFLRDPALLCPICLGTKVLRVSYGDLASYLAQLEAWTLANGGTIPPDTA